MSKKAIAETTGVHRKMLSQTWEDKKTVKIDFPKLGKHEKRKKIVIPTLGNMKNSENQLSYVWENRKMPQAAFPTPRKNGKCEKLFIARERNAENAKNSVSLASDERKTLKTVHRS